MCRTLFHGDKKVLVKICVRCFLKACHDNPDTGGHFGRDKTFRKLSQRYYWKAMKNYVQEYACPKCFVSNSKVCKDAPLLHPTSVPAKIWSLVGLQRCSVTQPHICTCQDLESGWAAKMLRYSTPHLYLPRSGVWLGCKDAPLLNPTSVPAKIWSLVGNICTCQDLESGWEHLYLPRSGVWLGTSVPAKIWSLVGNICTCQDLESGWEHLYLPRSRVWLGTSVPAKIWSLVGNICTCQDLESGWEHLYLPRSRVWLGTSVPAKIWSLVGIDIIDLFMKLQVLTRISSPKQTISPCGLKP